MRLLRWPIHISVDVEWPVFIQRIFSRTIRPVVVKSIQLRNLVDTEVGETDSLIAVLEFNNPNTNPDDPDYVDLNQLQSSLDRNGTFHIWTCSCGAPGCAGLFNGVHVTHSNNTQRLGTILTSNADSYSILKTCETHIIVASLMGKIN